jgi:hypothetical protein
MGFGAQVVIEEGAPALVRRRGGWNLDRAPTAPSPALATPTASRAVAPFPSTIADRSPSVYGHARRLRRPGKNTGFVIP